MNTLIQPHLPATDADAEQHQSQRVAVAVAVAPILLLLALTLVVAGLIDVDIGMAVFVICSAWLGCTLHGYQQAMADADWAAAADQPRR